MLAAGTHDGGGGGGRLGGTNQCSIRSAVMTTRGSGVRGVAFAYVVGSGQ